MAKNNKKRKWIKYLIIILVLLYGASHFIFNNKIDKNKINVRLYIDTSDEVSKGKLQVNWKYLAAIDAVRYKNDFTKVNSKDLKELANKFIINDKGKYRLKDIDEVLDKLFFNEKDKKKVYSYLEELKYIGLVSKNLKEGSANRKFINKLTPEAINLYKKYKILPSVTIAQAALESNWGKSKLASKANNLFGIKADKSWTGKAVTMETKEFYDKVINDKFRAYKDIDKSLQDYGKFLSENQRYKKYGVFLSNHYIEQAQAIEKSGYSTIENEDGEKIYARLLIHIIKENDLQIIDNKAEIGYY
ncbi:glucosaminidase domain-containing protein [Clostridium sp. MB40-C1]|uniref:glycoside hydrolase family 73 protein n=1 Tax=Clostridium sp. MB40-C1 TaxID=3070996 RepID=UPI0027E1665F|nr:glucosaminidase domain-containing protein [Clostridium sp. MB40-C1]WMJ82192.1 glucosaminidase domain-containing protein [Clostridium sp. MB40-C1]